MNKLKITLAEAESSHPNSLQDTWLTLELLEIATLAEFDRLVAVAREVAERSLRS